MTPRTASWIDVRGKVAQYDTDEIFRRYGAGHSLRALRPSLTCVRHENVHGAALAYGPLLRADPKLRAMQESVMHYAFCSPGTLRSDLGIPRDAGDLTIHVLPTRPPVRSDLELSWEVGCNG